MHNQVANPTYERDVFTNPPPPPPTPQSDPAASSMLAGLLRWLGAGAVILSGLIYMLQGIEFVDVDLRNWVYLGLMGLLAASGVASRMLMEDAKGARLLFALAVLLIPIQFSQIGAMIFHQIGGGAGALPELFTFESASIGTTIAFTLGSLAIAIPIAFFGLSVLVREHARNLTMLFLVLCCVILLPIRDGVIGFAVLAALAVAALALERRMFQPNSLFRTAEGLGVRSLFLLPVAIVAGRYAFHVDPVAGTCALGGLASLFCIRGIANWVNSGWLKELILIAGGTLGTLSWVYYAAWSLSFPSDAYLVAGAFLPAAAILFEVSRHSSIGWLYRVLGSLIAGTTAFALLSWESGLEAKIVTTLIGAALLAWGVYRREREQTFTGTVVTVLGVVATVVFAVSHVTVNAWIVLALLGVALVLGSSMLERYGRRVAGYVGDAWNEVSDWK